MVVYVLIREDQNEHGYVDTSITGIYEHEQTAKDQEALERQNAKAQGLIVEDDLTTDADWQVSWKTEAHPVS